MENFKDIIFEGIKCFVPHKNVKPKLDHDYYNKEIRRLKVKVRRAYSKRKLGDHFQEELRRLSKKTVDCEKRGTGNILELSFTR